MHYQHTTSPVKNKNILIIQPASSANIDWTRSLAVGLVLAVFISFINLFLKPFKTAESSTMLVLGYSACFLASYGLAYFFEYTIFKHLKPIWANRTVAFFIMLFLLSDLSIYLYDLMIIKAQPLSWNDFIPFTFRVMLPFGFIVLPMIYIGRTARIAIRQGDEIDATNEVILKGASSGEVLHTTSDKILYARAEDNYCNIFYLNAQGVVSHKLFRIKISDLADQIDCLTRCHRTYAINLENAAHIQASKTKASVQIKWINETIPVSKSYLHVVNRAE